MSRTFTGAMILAAGLGLSSAASAGYETFTGFDANDSALTPLTVLTEASGAETAFKSRLSQGVSTEDFESKATGATSPLTLSFLNAATSVVTTALLAGGNGFVNAVIPGETDGFGRYSIPSATSSKFWSVDASGVNSSFTIEFSAAIAAFGFYGIDIGDFGGQVQIDLLAADMTTVITSFQPSYTIGVDGSTDGSVLYFGVVAGATDGSEDFHGLRFSSTRQVADVFAFDNFTIATRDQIVEPPNGVPAPGTLALLGAALLGFGARRKQH